MDSALVLVRLALALILAVAAINKLLDRRGTRDAATALGVPERLAPATSILLPAVELVAVALLLPGATAWAGALLSLLLFVVFTAAVGNTLRRNVRPACHCFGSISDEPISARTIVRNGILAAAALFVVVGGPGGAGPGAVQWVSDGAGGLGVDGTIAVLGAGVLGLLAVVVVMIGALADLSRRVGTLELFAPPPEIGLPLRTPAPSFKLPDLDGRRWTLDSLVEGWENVILLFTSPGCGPCQALLPKVPTWSDELGDNTRIVVVSTGTIEENRAKAEEAELDLVLVQKEYEVAGSYRYGGTPSAVIVNSGGLIASRLAVGIDEVESMIEDQIDAVTGASIADRVGRTLPEFHLHATNGAHVDDDALAGSLSFLLFWDPDCSFCNLINDDLSATLTELRGAGGLPVVISRGDEDENLRVNVSDLVLTDPNGEYASRLRVPGTPTAVIVDASGRITDVAVGSDDVPALAERARSLATVAAGLFADRPTTS